MIICCDSEAAVQNNQTGLFSRILHRHIKHPNMVWHQIKSAKVEERDLKVVHFWYLLTSCAMFGLFCKVKAEHILKIFKHAV